MARKPLRFGGRSFATKKAAGDAIREVLYRYELSATLSEEDVAFMASVLGNHPEFEQKVGCGVASFQVESNGPTRGFWITRVDGSRTDFSFLSCLTPPTAAQDARAGLRSEIRDQVVAFRDAAFASAPLQRCAVTDEVVSATTCHVDHYDPTFLELVDRFLAAAGLTIEQIAVVPTSDGSTETRLANAELIEVWRTFHQTHARLRIVSRRANLSLLRRGG